MTQKPEEPASRREFVVPQSWLLLALVGGGGTFIGNQVLPSEQPAVMAHRLDAMEAKQDKLIEGNASIVSSIAILGADRFTGENARDKFEEERSIRDSADKELRKGLGNLEMRVFILEQQEMND